MSKVAAATTVTHVSDSAPTTAPVQKNARPRIAWIDIAKGVAILAIVAGHCIAQNSLTKNILFSFHVPLFFILTGYTFGLSKTFKDFLRRTVKDFLHLIIPTVLMVGAYGILRILIFGADPAEEFHNFLVKLFWSSGTGVYITASAHMWLPWFFVATFFAKLFLRILYLIFKDNYKIISILCGFVGVAFLDKGFALPFGISTALVGLFFMVTGVFAKDYQNIIQKYRIPLFIIATFLLYGYLRRGLTIDIALYIISLDTIIEAFCSCFIVCEVCKILADLKIARKLLSLIGKNTMMIATVHYLDWTFNFLYKQDNLYLRMIVRILLVLVYAWAFTVVFHGICRCLRFLRNRHIKRKVVA